MLPMPLMKGENKMPDKGHCIILHYVCNIYRDMKVMLLSFLDKPSAPGGPLVAEEVRANHVKVKWQKPEDSGGTAVTGYVLEKMDLDIGRWAPAGEVNLCILKTVYLLLYSCSEVIKINHLNTSMLTMKLLTYHAYFGKFLSSSYMYN